MKAPPPLSEATRQMAAGIAETTDVRQAWPLACELRYYLFAAGVKPCWRGFDLGESRGRASRRRSYAGELK